ncbi:MAG: hypothetical protein OEO20_11450 [Gemmatimonadota bacterium]|nr:hypothetical protein [Gemmatimonadota bacterium]MDH3366520.1 hypothetical protein [Gemmatimonadota bacterium]MDH3478909.1 hypothetical protein [Gemmatimonadota bacterium]
MTKLLLRVAAFLARLARPLKELSDRHKWVNWGLGHPGGYLLLGPVPFALGALLLRWVGLDVSLWWAVLFGSWFSWGHYIYREPEDFFFRIMDLEQDPATVLWLEDRLMDILGPTIVHGAVQALLLLAR